MDTTIYSKHYLIHHDIKQMMFELLEGNMSKIAPIHQDKAVIYREWEAYFDTSLQTGTKHIVITDQDKLRGYLTFTIRYASQDVIFHDVQIDPFFQRDGVTIGKLFFLFYWK